MTSSFYVSISYLCTVVSSEFSCNVLTKVIWLYCHYCNHNTKQLISVARKQGCICNPISYSRLINDHRYRETAEFKSVMYSLCQLCVVVGKPSLFWSGSPSGKQMFFSSGLWIQKDVLSFFSFFFPIGEWWSWGMPTVRHSWNMILTFYAWDCKSEGDRVQA